MADLDALRALTPDAREQWHWRNVGLRFDVAVYLTSVDPPLELVVSARAITLRGGEVFVFEADGQTHAIPGGRREPGEAPDAALVREIREETGCAIVGEPRRLGILHCGISCRARKSTGIPTLTRSNGCSSPRWWATRCPQMTRS